MRLNKVYCFQCVTIYCAKCADKMVIEYGSDAFREGCPMCKGQCCCSEKSESCARQFHCYKKCPFSKASIRRTTPRAPANSSPSESHSSQTRRGRPKRKEKKKRKKNAHNQCTSNGTRKSQESTPFDFPPHITETTTELVTPQQQMKKEKRRSESIPTDAQNCGDTQHCGSRRQQNQNYSLLLSPQQDLTILTGSDSWESLVHDSSGNSCPSSSISSADPVDFKTFFENVMATEGDPAAHVTSHISLGSIQNSISKTLLFSSCNKDSAKNEDSPHNLSLPHALVPPPEVLSLQHIFSLSSGDASSPDIGVENPVGSIQLPGCIVPSHDLTGSSTAHESDQTSAATSASMESNQSCSPVNAMSQLGHAAGSDHSLVNDLALSVKDGSMENEAVQETGNTVPIFLADVSQTGEV